MAIKRLLEVPRTVDSANVVISPEVASKLLSYNTCNRTLSKQRINDYARMMTRGEWSVSPDAISFDDNAVLTNGQHRLLAAVAAKVPCKFLVAFSIQNSMNIDMGRTRSLTDNLCLSSSCCASLREDKSIHQLMRSACALYTGESRRKRPTPKQVENLVNKYEKELIECKSAGLFAKDSGVGQAGVLAGFFLAYLAGAELSTLVHIKAILNNGVAESNYDTPIIALRDKLMALKGGSDALDGQRCFLLHYCIRAVQKRSVAKRCVAQEGIFSADFSDILNN